MPYKIQRLEDQLDSMASMFASYADGVQEQLNKLDQQHSNLIDDKNWEGQAAQAYDEEWTGEVRPKIVILQQGMDAANQQTRKINDMFSQAEMTIQNFFAQL